MQCDITACKDRREEVRHGRRCTKRALLGAWSEEEEIINITLLLAKQGKK